MVTFKKQAQPFILQDFRLVIDFLMPKAGSMYLSEITNINWYKALIEKEQSGMGYEILEFNRHKPNTAAKTLKEVV